MSDNIESQVEEVIAEEIVAEEVAEVAAEEEKQSYSGLYAKKSGKPLQQVYGHIDRISPQSTNARRILRALHPLDHQLCRPAITQPLQKFPGGAATARIAHEFRTLG